MTELLPCPFCGSHAELREFKRDNGTRWKYDGIHGEIKCSNEDCFMGTALSGFWFVEGEEGNELQDIITAWNTRPATKGE